MPGQADLQTLLATMEPALDPEEYVFCLAAGMLPVDALCVFREDEGLTLIVPRAQAEREGLAFTYPCRRIVPRVQSDLNAIGFLAALTTELARAGIGVNPVAAYTQDHLFVATELADRALACLRDLASRARAGEWRPSW